MNALPEVLIPQVEVVAGHPPVGLGEGVLRRRGPGVALVGGPDPLELLRHPDRRHAGPAGGGLPVQVGLHHVDLALALAEPHPRDPVGGREGFHRAAELRPDLFHQRRRGDRHAQVLGHERDHLAAGLQDRDVRVEVDPVQALDVQHRMPVQQLPGCHYMRHYDHLPLPALWWS